MLEEVYIKTKHVFYLKYELFFDIIHWICSILQNLFKPISNEFIITYHDRVVPVIAHLTNYPTS